MRTVKEIARRNQDQIFAKTWSKVDQQVVLETKHDTRSQTVTETTCQPPHDHEAMTGARTHNPTKHPRIDSGVTNQAAYKSFANRNQRGHFWN